MLHVVQVSFYLDPQRRPADALLAGWPSLSRTAEAATLAGVRVSVVQAAHERSRRERASVQYLFEPPGPEGRALETAVQALRPDVLHVHGLAFAGAAATLRRALPAIPLLLQDHADRVPRPWRRRRWRRDLAAADGIAFCAAEQARPFQRAALLAPRTEVFEIVECSSDFQPGPASAARTALSIHGDPLLLWVGHLDANKDPLTVLAGISEVVPAFPGLQLWCCFGTAPLRQRVERHIAGDPQLRGRVHLLGPQPHARIEQFMQAADAFVLGSHREGSGYSVLEALACGVPPVITDIPSYRMLTGRGAVGALWQPGDARSCAGALRRVLSSERQTERTRARQQFERELSITAFGTRLRDAYVRLSGPPSAPPA